MSTWVINASPLILLGKIDRLGLLPILNPSIHIPNAVSKEILAGPDSDPAKKWLSEMGKQHVVPDVPTPAAILAWDLGAGESAVISIALLSSDSVCVLDDLAARSCAMVYGLKITGTLGLLLKAKRRSLIPNISDEIEKLLSAGSMLSPSIISEATKLARE